MNNKTEFTCDFRHYYFIYLAVYYGKSLANFSVLFHWNYYFSGTDEEGGYSAAVRMRLHSRTRLRTKGRDKGHEQSSASNKVRLYSYMIKSYKVSIIKLSVIHDRMGILISTLIPTVIYSR